MRLFSMVGLALTFVLATVFVAPDARPTSTPPPSTAPPTGTIEGQVQDAKTGDPLPGANVRIDSLGVEKAADKKGRFVLKNVPVGTHELDVQFVGYDAQSRSVTVEEGRKTSLTVRMKPSTASLDEVVVTEDGVSPRRSVVGNSIAGQRQARAQMMPSPQRPRFDRENYARIEESGFRAVSDAPLSTFAIDVDGASYTNVRRFIRDGERPPVDAVRIEEMLNYFTYDYPGPSEDADAPFASTMEVGAAPWNPEHRLVHVGLQGRRIDAEDRPASNLVFLLDVSGSMNSPNKLGLLKRGISMLVDQMRPQDRVAVVVYAGASGLVLESTPGNQKDRILGAIEELQAGGSTAGAQGIRHAYRVAQENFIEDGVNRVLLATDGDFNVGVSSTGELTRLIEEKREEGTFLTVLGFGTGNLQDAKMEQLANKGNGAYFYVDTVAEAKRVLVDQVGSTLQTIAKDVKVQVEFNPAEVKAYRLIGYENRALNDEDFADDTKDAGELGAGHSVTVLYEIVPATSPDTVRTAGDLRYQRDRQLTDAASTGEMLTLKLRYKAPDGDESQLMTSTLPSAPSETLSTDFQFASAVAGFGMLLRDSEHKGAMTFDDVRRLAEAGRGDDADGTRAGFIALVEEARPLFDADETRDRTAQREQE